VQAVLTTSIKSQLQLTGMQSNDFLNKKGVKDALFPCVAEFSRYYLQGQSKPPF